jgi:N,N-dimethylformamidase
MLLLTGYAERLSAREGETLRFHVANATGEPVRAKVVRVVCADPNPQIGGVVTEPVPLAVSTLVEPGPQVVPSGSYAVVGISGLPLPVEDCTFTIRLHPTLKMSRRQVVLSCLDERGRGLELELTPALTLRGRIGIGSGEATVESRGPVPLNAWSTVTLTVDSTEGTLVLSVTTLAAHAIADTVLTTLSASASASTLAAGGSRRLSLASGSDQAPVDTFNGRLENPKLFARALSSGDVARVWAGESVDGLIGAWDFSREMHTRRIIDTGPGGHHGELVNTPTRAVTRFDLDGA